MSFTVEERLAEIEALFGSPALAKAYGEGMAIRDHMLQCAELAVADGHDEPLVAAALLHDIGWGMERPHEIAAADWLAPRLGPAVAEPVRWHVAAKRYLVATHPGYAARLSAASRATLVEQAGPMTSTECATFAAMPVFDAAIKLRLLDDAGKADHPPRAGFADYAPLLERLLIETGANH